MIESVRSHDKTVLGTDTEGMTSSHSKYSNLVSTAWNKFI